MHSEKGQVIRSLKAEKDIKAVLFSGQRVESRQLRFYYNRNGLTQIRIGVFIPKKVFKQAVLRNRAKRIIKSILRQNRNKLGGLDFICLLKNMEKEDLETEILSNIVHKLIRKIPRW